MKLQHSWVVSRTPTVVSDDKSNILAITTYALTGALIVCFIARQIMKSIVFRKIAIDDLFMLLATVSAIALAVTTLLLASKGFGVLGPLTVERANIIMKGYYTSELLYMSSLCFSKLSILVLFYNVVVLRAHRFFVLGFGLCICGWTVASIVAAAFQCGLPRPWEMMTLRCFNTRIFWIIYCIIDMSTEVLIIVLSVDLVAHLRVRISRKFAVVACFAPRLLVIVAALVRAIYFYQVTPHGNPEYDLWISTICTHVHVCASICTACVPYMVPFFKSLQGNIWRSYSSRSSTAGSKSARLSNPPPNLLRKREANVRFESSKSSTSLIKEPERVSIVSPRIPSPIPVSPFMPPPMSTLRIPKRTTNMTTQRDAQALSISGTLYDSESDETFDIISLQTAICFAPSPIEPPAQARLSSAAIIDSSELFEHRALLQSPGLSSASSCYSSRASTPTNSEVHPHFSLSAQDTQQYTQLRPILQDILVPVAQTNRSGEAMVEDGASRLLARQTLPNPALPHPFDDFVHPARSASFRTHPKFSTTPRLHASPPTTVPADRS